MWWRALLAWPLHCDWSRASQGQLGLPAGPSPPRAPARPPARLLAAPGLPPRRPRRVLLFSQMVRVLDIISGERPAVLLSGLMGLSCVNAMLVLDIISR